MLDSHRSNIGHFTATKSWKTNGDASSQVLYDTVSHDSIADYAHYTRQRKSLVKKHKVTLNKLSPSTTYYYRVASAADKAEVVSDERTFTTLAMPGGWRASWANLFQTRLPILFEVSLKGSNTKEYQYLTYEHPVTASQAESILKKQIRGYEILCEKSESHKNISVLARLGIFHSSINKPTFYFVYPGTKELMFNPKNWSPEILKLLTDQRRIWGDLFDNRLVVEKLKTPADRSPGIGRRYRHIINILKTKDLLQEATVLLPPEFKNSYFYKRGNEVYWRCSSRLKVESI